MKQEIIDAMDLLEEEGAIIMLPPTLEADYESHLDDIEKEEKKAQKRYNLMLAQGRKRAYKECHRLIEEGSKTHLVGMRVMSTLDAMEQAFNEEGLESDEIEDFIHNFY